MCIAYNTKDVERMRIRGMVVIYIVSDISKLVTETSGYQEDNAENQGLFLCVAIFEPMSFIHKITSIHAQAQPAFHFSFFFFKEKSMIT